MLIKYLSSERTIIRLHIRVVDLKLNQLDLLDPRQRKNLEKEILYTSPQAVFELTCFSRKI
jgi:hypothetical protein